MKIRFDSTTDAATITVSDATIATESSVGDHGSVSRDAAGNVVMVEVHAGASALGLPDEAAARRIVAQMVEHFTGSSAAS